MLEGGGMVKVEVFSTGKEAQEKLNQFIFKNHDVVSSMVTELLLRATVYRASAEFKRSRLLDTDAPFTKKEAELLCKGLKQEGKANSFVRLYRLMEKNNYGFTYASVNPYDYAIFNSYDSVKSLAKRIHQEVTKPDYELLGLKSVPMLYTILEATTFPEKKRQQARELPEYRALTLEQKIICEQEFDKYLEKGLTTVEINSFIGEYAKFFN